MATTATKISPVNMESRQKLGIRAGDTVRVWQKIEEKGKTRLQAFEGMVLARKHGNEAGGTFTVRRVTSGVGMEKIFPLYASSIDKIEIVRRSKVRRAKLYHIREKVAREIRRQMRRMQMVSLTTGSDMAEKDAALQVADVEAKKAEAAESALIEAQKSPLTDAQGNPSTSAQGKPAESSPESKNGGDVPSEETTEKSPEEPADEKKK